MPVSGILYCLDPINVLQNVVLYVLQKKVKWVLNDMRASRLFLCVREVVFVCFYLVEIAEWAQIVLLDLLGSAGIA